MERIDFYNDKKYCPACEEYVTYLMAVGHSYCTSCGSEVRLFSDGDWATFNHGIGAKRPKGGRKKKGASANKRDTA